MLHFDTVGALGCYSSSDCEVDVFHTAFTDHEGLNYVTTGTTIGGPGPQSIPLGGSVPNGAWITVTITDPTTSNTSEFAISVQMPS